MDVCGKHGLGERRHWSCYRDCYWFYIVTDLARVCEEDSVVLFGHISHRVSHLLSDTLRAFSAAVAGGLRVLDISSTVR